MNILDYNKIQMELFKKYNIECMVTNDSVRFFKICSLISLYRNDEYSEDTYKAIESTILEQLRERDIFGV